MSIVPRQTIAAELERQYAIQPSTATDGAIFDAVAASLGIPVDLVAEVVGDAAIAAEGVK